MDRLYLEKCKELAEVKRENSQKAIETLKKTCDECEENQGGGWCGNCRYEEFVEALSTGDPNGIDVGSILWEMHGKRRNREIKWYPAPKCVEEITEHMYLFGDGCGISHNGVGHNMFLSRRECLDNFLKSHDALVTKSDYGEDIPENCYELPRTDWQDYEVCKFDGVSATSVYMNGLNQLLDVSRQISWRKESCEYRGDIEVLTLTEIYEQLAKEGYRPIITVFVNDPRECSVFQCGNYEPGRWVHLGKVMGYA